MLTIIVQIVGITLMLTFMFIGVWGFILLHKIFNQLRYKNYLMEKLTQNIYMLSTKMDNNKESTIDLMKDTEEIKKEIFQS